jgi:hypothetical protein
MWGGEVAGAAELPVRGAPDDIELDSCGVYRQGCTIEVQTVMSWCTSMQSET